MWELRWNVGASGGWGSKGLVRGVGNMVGRGHGKGVHGSSKAVRDVLEAVEGKENIAHDCQVVRTMKLSHDITVSGRFRWRI